MDPAYPRSKNVSQMQVRMVRQAKGKGENMRKLCVLMLLLCIIGYFNLHTVMACTEDCDKECDYETSHAETVIRDSCEESAEFYNKLAALGGNKPPYDQSWIDQCVVDSRASYRQDCMNGCDKCEHDKKFLGGCFVDSIPID